MFYISVEFKSETQSLIWHLPSWSLILNFWHYYNIGWTVHASRNVPLFSCVLPEGSSSCMYQWTRHNILFEILCEWCSSSWVSSFLPCTPIFSCLWYFLITITNTQHHVFTIEILGLFILLGSMALNNRQRMHLTSSWTGHPKLPKSCKSPSLVVICWQFVSLMSL